MSTTVLERTDLANEAFRCAVAPSTEEPTIHLYIAGPMRDYPLYNFPTFDQAAAWLRDDGYKVISPAEMDRELGFDETADEPLPEGFIENAMRRDIEALLKVDGIVLLPGWEASSGVAIELRVARALGLSIYTLRYDNMRSFEYDVFGHRRCLGTLVDYHWTELEPTPDAGAEVRAAEPLPVIPEWPPFPAWTEELAAAIDVEENSANPKDRYGDAKPPLHLVPSALLIYVSKVMQLGAKKYGAFNWRTKRVNRTTYYSAALRHLLAAMDGEDVDSETGQPHEASVAACMGIVLDAKATGNLIDDRPTPGAAAALIADLTEVTP